MKTIAFYGDLIFHCYIHKRYIVMHVTIARQRFGKNIPEDMLSTLEGHSLPDNEPMNTRL
jgi:hypothetical protein